MLLAALLTGCVRTRTVTCYEFWDGDPTTPGTQMGRMEAHEIAWNAPERNEECQSYCNAPDGGDWCTIVDSSKDWLSDVTAP